MYYTLYLHLSDSAEAKAEMEIFKAALNQAARPTVQGKGETKGILTGVLVLYIGQKRLYMDGYIWPEKELLAEL